jgi:MFS family permease
VYFTNTFMIAYTTQQLALPRSLILECLFFVAIIQFCIQPLAAWVAEKIGATRFLCLVSLLAMASPYPMFVLVSSAQAPLIILGIALAVVCMASFYAVIAGYVSGMFETRVRYTAISLAYQICGALAGGLTPLIGTLLAHKFAGQWWPMAVFYSLIAATSLVCVLSLARRHASAERVELATH